MSQVYQSTISPFRVSSAPTNPPSQKRARLAQLRLPRPPRPETPPPVYEKIPRYNRVANPDNGSPGLEATLPIYGQAREDSNEVLWKTKKGIIMFSVLATALLFGGILGIVLGLTASHHGRVPSLQKPAGIIGSTSTGSSTSNIASAPVVPSQGSVGAGGLGTHLPSDPSPSIFDTSSKTSIQAVMTAGLGTSAAMGPGEGERSQGDGGNTAGSSTLGSNTGEATSEPTIVSNHPAGSSSTSSSPPNDNAKTSLTILPDPGGGPTATPNHPASNTGTNGSPPTDNAVSPLNLFPDPNPGRTTLPDPASSTSSSLPTYSTEPPHTLLPALRRDTRPCKRPFPRK